MTFWPLTEPEIAALSLSLKVASLASLSGLPFAIFTGYIMARKNFPFKNIIDSLLHLPLVVPPVVVGYILLVTFAPNGTIGAWLAQNGITIAFHWHGAALASFIMAFPLMLRSIRLSFETIPPVYEQAALSLGASKIKIFFKIFLPLAAPGLISAFILGFARAIGEFGATITVAANIPTLTQTLPLAIYSAAQNPGDNTAAIRLIILSLIPAIASLIASNYLAHRHWKKQKAQQAGG